MKKNKQMTSKLLGICCTSVVFFMLSSVNIFAKSNVCSPTSSNINKVACDSFRVGGDKFTQSGNYVINLLNSEGCDSTVNLELTIYNTPSAPMLSSTFVCGEGVDTLNVLQIGRVNMPNPFVYTWYDAEVDGNEVGNGEQFITPNLTQTTPYYATLSYMGCESQRNQVDAVVNFIPSAPYVAESNPVCGEGAFTFEAMMPARINCRNCDPFDYEWTNTNGDVVGIDPVYSTGTLSSSASYFVTTSYNGCKSEAKVVWAEVLNIPAPSITESNPFACFGLPTELQVANAVPTRVTDCRGCNEMYDYTWYNENEDSVGTTSSFTTPILMEPSIYYLVASDRGCKSLPTKIEIAVKQAAKITQSPANVFACGEGEILGIKVKAIGDELQYGLGVILNGQIIESGPIDADTFSFESSYEINGLGLVYFVFNDCAIDTSDVALITLYNKVDTTVVLTDKTLSAKKSGVQYQWINCDANGVVIDGENNQSYSPTVSGNYAVIVYDPSACNLQDTSTCKYVDVNVTSVSDSQTATLSVYPNPASDVVNVTLPSSINGGVVTISDIHGNEVVSKSVSGLEFSVTTAEMPSGVYILKVSSSTFTATKQIVVVK